MYNFEKELIRDEKIIYQGSPVPGKGAKNIGGLLFVFLFCLGLQILMIWSLVAKVGDGTGGINFSFIAIFFPLIVIESFSMYGIIYNCFIKKRKLKDHYYCLTTERVLKYEKNKDRLVYGYLYNYDDIHYGNSQEGYGDVYFSIKVEKSGDSKQDLINLKNAITNPDFTNMTYIAFESISNPKKISVLAKKARDEIKIKYNKETIK